MCVSKKTGFHVPDHCPVYFARLVNDIGLSLEMLIKVFTFSAMFNSDLKIVLEQTMIDSLSETLT